MVLRRASGRRTFRRRIVWRPHCAPERSGSTATTSSTRHCRLVATNNRDGGARWVKTFSHSTRRPSRFARGCRTVTHPVERRAPREPALSEVEGSSRAGTPGSPPTPLVVWCRSLLALFLLLISRFLFGFGIGAFDRVFHDLARDSVDVHFVDAIRHLDVEGIDQLSFFPFNLFRLNFAGLLGQGSLLRLFHGDLRFFAQSSLAGLALAACPRLQSERKQNAYQHCHPHFHSPASYFGFLFSLIGPQVFTPQLRRMIAIKTRNLKIS